jgi:hypothetical protein
MHRQIRIKTSNTKIHENIYMGVSSTRTNTRIEGRTDITGLIVSSSNCNMKVPKIGMRFRRE